MKILGNSNSTLEIFSDPGVNEVKFIITNNVQMLGKTGVYQLYQHCLTESLYFVTKRRNLFGKSQAGSLLSFY